MRFAIIAASGSEHEHWAFDELKELMAGGGLDVEPAFVPSYAAMYGVMEQGICAFGWAPPLVARDLLRGRNADPVALVMRARMDTYYSALVTRPESKLWQIGQLATARIGWVSRLSAAGFVVPRAYLASVRVPLTFARETFHYTHARLAEALDKDAVDVIATYAVVRDAKALHVPHLPAYNVLAVAGPIPGELVVAARGVDKAAIDAAADALLHARLDPERALTRSLSVTGFAPPPAGYVDFLSRWEGRTVWPASGRHPATRV
jgi:ABC-type phosphate/phosphonate transport system substrate-binding protein